METVLLGRTGLKATVGGLGGGGFSRLGIKKFGVQHAAGLVRTAYDNGVNFFDTAMAYGTQPAVGLGLRGLPRDSYILSTKFTYHDGEGIRSPAGLMEALEESLRLLETDYIDIYHLHGVTQEDYGQTLDKLLPAMHKAQEKGMIRYLGITERFAADTSHKMLIEALNDDFFDVVMVGYNLLNPSAAIHVLPAAMEKGVGVLCMFAVRSALSNPEQLKIDIGRILEKGQANPGVLSPDEDLAFLRAPEVAGSVMEAAYRYCRHTKGIHVTLTGTANADHLKENLHSIQLPPLPEHISKRLREMFGGVDCISGQ